MKFQPHVNTARASVPLHTFTVYLSDISDILLFKRSMVDADLRKCCWSLRKAHNYIYWNKMTNAFVLGLIRFQNFLLPAQPRSPTKEQTLEISHYRNGTCSNKNQQTATAISFLDETYLWRSETKLTTLIHSMDTIEPSLPGYTSAQTYFSYQKFLQVSRIF